MSNDLSKALKRKTDAQLRLIEQDSAPIVRETVSGDVYTVSPTEYMQTLAAGTNITITTAGNVKTISAAMNLLGGAGITISEPDANGQVTVSGTVSDTTILGKTVEVADFTGKDGYVLTYDETAGKFVLSEQSGVLPQATETILGGVRAKAKTTETAEVAIDASTGQLFAPAPDEAANGIPAGGTAGQVLSKKDTTDFNAEWIDPPSGGGGYANLIDVPPTSPHALDDEFNGDSSLSSAWTWLNQGSASAEGVDSRFMKFSMPNSNQIRGVVKSIPSGGCTISTKLMGVDRTGNCKHGLLVSESLTGKQYLGLIYLSAAYAPFVTWNTYTTPAQFSSYELGTPFASLPAYIKVRVFFDSSWKAELSYSMIGQGLGWKVFQVTTLGFTPALVGLGFINESGNASNDYFVDWFRVNE